LWNNHCVEECEREALAAIKQWKALADNPLKSAFQALPILLGLCTACVISLPTDASTPIPSTFTPGPTDARVPTDTRQPVPTSTPAPTQPASSPHLEVQLYASQIGGQLQTLIDAVQDISAMTQNPKLSSDTWKKDLSAQLEIVSLVHQELTNMEVPIEMVGIHSAVLNATSYCDFATDHVQRGIDNMDPRDVQIATMLWIRCRENMNVPLEMINEYLNQSSFIE
jgi:hypothetical protein